jgi:hypothetical protein
MSRDQAWLSTALNMPWTPRTGRSSPILMPLPVEMVVQRRQGDVGEQRRENSAL